MCQTTFKAISDQIVLVAAREGLNQKPVWRRQYAVMGLQLEPFCDLRRKMLPLPRITNHVPTAVREVRAQGHAVAAINRNARFCSGRGGVPANEVCVTDLDELQQPTCEQETVAGSETVCPILLNVTERLSATNLDL